MSILLNKYGVDRKKERGNVISPSSYLASGDPLAKAISISSIKVLGFP